ncbi:MAG: DinB family protein [Lacipirellulaceae bacterium]
MLTNAINVLRYLEGYGDSLVADVGPEDFCRRPLPGMNHPAWVFGHLAYASDRHGTLLGNEQRLLDWQPLFAKGSAASDDPTGYPTKDDLLAAWRAANARLIAAVESASPEKLASPNEYLKNPLLPTIGDFLTYSMTGHTSSHLGQVSAWRRACGRPAMF